MCAYHSTETESSSKVYGYSNEKMTNPASLLDQQALSRLDKKHQEIKERCERNFNKFETKLREKYGKFL